jgi:hypothetical protein
MVRSTCNVSANEGGKAGMTIYRKAQRVVDTSRMRRAACDDGREGVLTLLPNLDGSLSSEPVSHGTSSGPGKAPARPTRPPRRGRTQTGRAASPCRQAAGQTRKSILSVLNDPTSE